MDLKLYYDKIREAEARILEDFPVVISNATPDGGKEGTKTEVPRRLAAKLIVEGLARLASEEEIRAFREALEEAQRIAEQVAAAARVEVAVLSSVELAKLRSAGRSKK
jgi:hypothetical protein